MRAIVSINGRQYEIEEGRYFQIDRLPSQENEELVFENVVMVVAGEQSLVGAPYVQGATVKARIRRHFRGPKVLVYKMRPKKGYRLKQGHRSEYTEVQVIEVDFPGREKYGPKAAPVEAKPRPKKETAKAEAPVAKPAKSKVVEQPAPAEQPAPEATTAPTVEPATGAEVEAKPAPKKKAKAEGEGAEGAEPKKAKKATGGGTAKAKAKKADDEAAAPETSEDTSNDQGE